MNEVHKGKMADRQAQRFFDACARVRRLCETAGIHHPATVAARRSRNGIGARLVELDGHYRRYDAILSGE